MVTPDEFEKANQRAQRLRRRVPAAITAHYDAQRRRVVVGLSQNLEVSFPPDSVEGLENAEPSDLEPIEITPSGFGLHFPKLDADVYLPALLEGVLGSKRWMAAQLGAMGGKAKTVAKAASSRRNGLLGGRPAKTSPKAKRRA